MAATNHAKIVKQDSIDFITQAVFQLLEKQDFTELKIGDVCKKAGVSRMTFYRNFESLENVISVYYENAFSPLFTLIANENMDRADKTVQLEMFFNENSHLFLLACERNFEFIIRNLFYEKMEMYYDTFPDFQEMNSEMKPYIVPFMTSGVYEIWKTWILTGRKKPLLEIQNLLRDLQDAVVMMK